MLEEALERSAELAGVVRATWESTPEFIESRARVVQGLCFVSIEHCCAVLVLLPALPASAIALVRPQYESLVRAAWATYAANDSGLGLLLAPLTPTTQQAAKKLPSVIDMLAMLEKVGPPGAAAMLGRVRIRLGDGLNSFIHGGIHPFARRNEGYPISLLHDVLKNSNALSILTLILLATLTNQDELASMLPELHESFADILPSIEPFADQEEPVISRGAQTLA